MIDYSFLLFFTDPILRAPTIGCMLMCVSASLVGVIVFLRKQSLLGEALSHAAYPGVISGVLLAGVLSIKESQEEMLSLCILLSAFLTSLLGLLMIQWLEKRFRVPSDAALCLVLSTFFGIGLTVASEVQFSYTSLYKQVLTYLYGQAATMTDLHVIIYGILSLFITSILFLFYKEIQVLVFDFNYAKSLGLAVSKINALLFILITLAVIIGIRSVGVILMSAMLIAPPVAARQFTNRLSFLFLLSALFGMISGFFGNYLSIRISEGLNFQKSNLSVILPTGPMIVLVASTLCLLALLFAPDRGLFIRLYRAAFFRYQCLLDNILKNFWLDKQSSFLSFDQLSSSYSIQKIYLKFLLWRMQKKGWIEKKVDKFYLTKQGMNRAAHLVRLHRLWEVYLVNDLGLQIEHVHCSAEEMEHVITPFIEQQLTKLMQESNLDLTLDPHHQLIPIKKSTDAS